MTSWQSKTKNRNKRWKVTVALTTGHSDVEEVYNIQVPSKRYALAVGVFRLLKVHRWLLDAEEIRFTHLSTHANHIQESKTNIPITQRYDSVYGEGLDD